MNRTTVAAAALVLLSVAIPARAEERPARGDERLAGIGSFEFQAGQYRPMIDSEFPLEAVGPWEKSFGTANRWLLKFHGGKALVHGYGTLEVGAGIGFTSFTGHGRFVTTDTVSPEKTGFRLIPITLDLTYRLDQVWERLGIPLVPYGRVALIRDLWWVTGAGGKTSKSGATDGWGWGGGVGLVLDFIDSSLARELDRDSGIKHTMLTVEVQEAKVRDFGSSKSWDLSNDGPVLSFGLLFAF
jgi:hypothetical protein